MPLCYEPWLAGHRQWFMQRDGNKWLYSPGAPILEKKYTITLWNTSSVVEGYRALARVEHWHAHPIQPESFQFRTCLHKRFQCP